MSLIAMCINDCTDHCIVILVIYAFLLFDFCCFCFSLVYGFLRACWEGGGGATSRGHFLVFVCTTQVLEKELHGIEHTYDWCHQNRTHS